MKPGIKLGLILGGGLLVMGFAVIAAIVAFTLFSISSGTQRARELAKKQTAETAGAITNVSLTSAGTIHTYKYEVNGVSYTATYYGTRTKSTANYERDVGRKGTVCYDPSDPSSSDFYYEKTTPCGGSR